MPVSGEDATINFSVKEMFGDIKRSIEAIDIKLDAKADHVTVVELAGRIAKLAGRIAKLETDEAYARGLGRAAWAIVGLLLAIAGLLIPIVISILDK